MSIGSAIGSNIGSAIGSALAGGGASWSPLSLFAAGEKGVWFDFTSADNLFTDAAQTIPVVSSGDLIGAAIDLSGNDNHATQAGAIRPSWTNDRAEFASGDYLTTAIDFSGTDTVTVVAAIYKAVGASTRYICEHGSNAGTEAGFAASASPFSNASGFGVTSRGSALASANNSPNSPPPLYAVVSGILRVSADTCVLRVNGQIAEVAITDQGTGNYQNATLYISAGADGTNFWFGTNQYQLLVIDRELTEDELLRTEQLFGESVGVTISESKYLIVAMGDSLTYAINGGVTADQAYVKLLDTRQSRITYSVNAGVSGDSTSEMVARKWQLLRYSTPNIAVIYGGTNDVDTGSTVQAAPSPTTTTFSIGAGLGAYYGAGGWVLVDGVQRQILSVAGDAITLAVALPSPPSAGATVAHDTQQNLTDLATYVSAAGCQRVMIVGMHYFNFTATADTTSVELARNATLRAKQSAAAAAAGAAYVDTYAWMAGLITDATYVQGDFGWHVANLDQHLNAAGQEILADAIESAMADQGWVTL